MSDRSSVAAEAARLLYIGSAEEYIQAKKMAAASIGSKAKPSNFEVAIELDRIAEELEGAERQRRLIEMRQSALRVMNSLSRFGPRLIGSVWRGTARMGSDIDLVVSSHSTSDVEEALVGYVIKEKGSVSFKGGVHAWYFKIDLQPDEVEVVVRDSADYEKERCDIFGDIKRGISLQELERLLRVDPIRRFIPRRNTR